jgi:hypothetical protein
LKTAQGGQRPMLVGANALARQADPCEYVDVSAVESDSSRCKLSTGTSSRIFFDVSRSMRAAPTDTSSTPQPTYLRQQCTVRAEVATEP